MTAVLLWIAVMLVVSIGMGYGKIFGFQSHEYRFLTNAILPFAVISGWILIQFVHQRRMLEARILG